MASEIRIGGAYSFADVTLAITSPFLTASLSRPGFSSEGIKVRMDGPKNSKKVGAGGAVMHSLIVSNSSKISLSLFKVGIGNSLLSAAYNQQKTSAAYWGRGVITLNNPISGDNITAQACAFEKLPDVTYDTEGQAVMEWVFDCGDTNIVLGSNNIAAVFASS